MSDLTKMGLKMTSENSKNITEEKSVEERVIDFVEWLEGKVTEYRRRMLFAGNALGDVREEVVNIYGACAELIEAVQQINEFTIEYKEDKEKEKEKEKVQ